MSVPQQSAEQRGQALAAALEARRERVRVRAAIKAGDLTAADVIVGAADDPVWAALPVAWLLACVPGLGPVRTERLMRSVGIAANRRVQGLGVHQRAALLHELGARR